MAPETVAERGEQEWRRLSCHASEGQQHGRQNAAVGGWDNDRRNGFPFASAEGHSTFAQRIGNRTKELLGASQRNGNHHQAKSESAGKG